ncbi:MAG: tRNA (adenosine(37)-N6)-threonylcarbamoyltransferase complex ATPase subunit type 1 TsaE [Acidobacteria bacterium]|nr:MAG: tRNA (adenosine(37)-N6)-threonylcarbamoyltransferase complex ATPase subunit type 1 TsaE [Acidobacteriota bacterium]
MRYVVWIHRGNFRQLANSHPSTQLSAAELTSSSPEETFNFGYQLGARLQGGEILLLSGPLGAGKTIFVKGICSALGIDEEEVTSPSFTLVNPYSGRLRLYHLDLYRLDEGASAAHAVDLEDLLADESSVIVIEWAERMGRYPLPDNVWRVSIEGDGDEPRIISIKLLSEVKRS